MNEVKLLPCPFCCGEAFFAKRKHCYGNVTYETICVICSNCGCKTEERICDEYYECYCTNEEIAEAWNTRKPVEEVLKKLRQLRIQDNLCDFVDDSFCEGTGSCTECAMELAYKIVKEGMGYRD